MRIAITGNMGCGKSTISKYLGGIDCDKVAKSLGIPVDKDRFFKDPEYKGEMESIIHPKVWEIVKNYPVVECPLLFEVGWQNRFDFIIAVVCRPEVQMSRLKERGLTEEEIKLRLSYQRPIEGADYVIDTSDICG
jgi:dephospho-CoA kinase